MRGLRLALLVAALSSCAPQQPAAPDAGPPPPPGAFIEAEPQRDGDPAEGLRVLLNEGTVGCGLPRTLYDQLFGEADEADRVPGRNARNEALPYDMTAFTAESGVEVVQANCFTCHAARIGGQLVLGLGAHAADFTGDASQGLSFLGGLLSDPAEQSEFARFRSRLEAVAPYIRTRVRGANPADNLAAILFAHRDRETLAWSDEPLLEPPPTDPVPVDVPPWWRMRDKHAMFYVASGRGDHARIMMTASALCVDTIEEAAAIDAQFHHVRSFIASLQPPAWPFAVDEARAARGAAVYASRCAACHGTPGVEGSYPNLVVPLDVVGTDPRLAGVEDTYQARFVDWFNGSFYGETARLDPQPGYVAPPLDGVWATAPYLHNGSVPTLSHLLDSDSRPARWARSFDDQDYDEERVGWRTIDVETAADGTVYDTALPGYGNQGHAYGDALPDDERADLIEHLKTL